ncbi:hypothetical protein [Winogradskyella ouciana]|uniref:Uncharacterized protein n=1 Tax=Winogradskyella ouciana TaxID=2608631 RepID=A0A7K1GDD8_9FLAO|nr:hypothetical protein [Winogradskyella ouciana]MTE27330.1 hypothetical protein [Winogradskyella ouciana]
MKKILTLTFFMCSMFYAMAQTDGITYQAVIIGPDDLELPGVDSEGNYLPNTTIAVRFTIYDSTNQIEFQEVQITETDGFGRINLLIGEAEHDYFKEMNWDGTPKDLKVEIDFEAGSNFEEMSRERLTFLPYAYHRNITATGTLTVDDKTFLNGELEVEGPTNLFSSLTVHNNNPTLLTGDLSVDGIANLNNALNVINGSPTNLSGDLSVDGNSNLDGTLDVIGLTTLNELTVNGTAGFGELTAERIDVTQGPNNILGTTVIDGLGAQIRITSDMPYLEEQYADINNHPLLIDGGYNGMAIRVEESRDNETNFITFYDDQRSLPWGRIEGETTEEFPNNADWEFDQASLDYDVFDAYADYAFSLIDGAIAAGALGAALADVRPCAGLGACIVSPGPAMIAAAVAQVAIEIGKITTSIIAISKSETARDTYNFNKENLKGVTYASGAGDYAEYLLRADLNEKMTYGDVVGVIGGKISKNTQDAENIMVVSYQPIVLGNMPEVSKEDNYEKVAFMGQVPVKVFGMVNIGDYIIPSGKNDGIGVAVPKTSIKLEDVKNIVGVAWSKSDNISGFNMVNVAVGLNTNDNSPIVSDLKNRVDKQTLEINSLKELMMELMTKVNNMEKGVSSNVSLANEDEDLYSPRDYEIVDNGHGETIYFKLTREDVIEGIALAEKQMKDSGVNLEENEFWTKMNSDVAFKEKFIDELLVKFDRVMHYHKEIDKKPRH